MLTSAIAAIPSETALLFLLALLISAAGFYRVVYFVSVGYAFSIAGMAVAAGWIFRDHLDLAVIAQCALLATYGLRLGGYILKREGSAAYRRELLDNQERGRGVKLITKLLIWPGVSLLYVLMFSPCLLNLVTVRSDGGEGLWSLPFGLGVMALGLTLEATADLQKSAYKRDNPARFCDTGLYRLVRCPNYLGEIVFWVGQWLAGLAALAHWVHWTASLIGLVCIVLIMMGSTKRLEGKQGERYGDDPEYQKYSSTVPVLFPFVPVYTLKNIRVYLE